MSLVSILIAAYNTEKWLAEAIESALGQTHPHVEVIVVDDGSTDGTLTVARSFEECGVKVIHQENQGACVARNRALSEAQGEFVKFLDADDALERDVIRIQIDRALDFHPNEHITTYTSHAYCDAMLKPERTWTRETWYYAALYSTDPAERVAALLTHNVRTLLPLHRREKLLEIGGFREDLRRGQEYDLHLRLALSGVRFLHIPYVGGYSRESDSNTRISNQPREDATTYMTLFRTRREQLTSLLGDPLPHVTQAALSRLLWNRFRSLLWSGDLEGARIVVREARVSDPRLRHTQSRAFRLLGRMFGPMRGEKILMLARSLVRGS